ncbi:MAG: tetratricopeptide repeat protein, partial [Gemmatimonadales bacterium]|nr:tetratricopeptide repeat protein [Gemmatimonadales bacterium]
VMGRTSVMAYAGTTKPVQEIANELGVGSIVEGSVQVIGDRLRVNVQLLDPETGAHVWAESYDRTLDDAFAIQGEVAQQVVTAVGAVVTGAESNALAAVPTHNAEAYRLYLQGEEYRRRQGYERQNYEIAQDFYERALALDSTFAIAYTSLAEVHGLLHWFGYDPSPARLGRARAAAEAAQKLAPELPQTRRAMGRVYYWERDFARALQELAATAEGLPGSAGVWEAIGAAHRRLGQWDQALAAYEKATTLNPRAADVFADLGGETFMYLHRYGEAIGALNRALGLAPDRWGAQLTRARTYLWWQGELDTLRHVLADGPESFAEFGPRALWRARLALWERKPDTVLALLARREVVMFETQEYYEPGLLYAAWAHQLRHDRVAAAAAFTGALAQLDSALRELPDDWRFHASRGLALAGLGRQADAADQAQLIEESVVYADRLLRGRLSESRAMIFAQAGLADEAVVELEPLLAGPSFTSVHMLRLDPRWDPIRDDPRFQALLVKYANPEPAQ